MEQDKRALRAEILDRISKENPNFYPAADCKIMQNILQLEEYQRAANVFLYISVGWEVDTEALVRSAFEAGKRVCVPVCSGNGVMYAAELSRPDLLVRGRYGIPTAPDGAPVVEPERLDFILVPGLGFDPEGRRLGRGGGYYDRYLSRVAEGTAKVGVCRQAQFLDAVPSQAHDQTVDWVVTEVCALCTKTQ